MKTSGSPVVGPDSVRDPSAWAGTAIRLVPSVDASVAAATADKVVRNRILFLLPVTRHTPSVR
ncbi:hypothetical protein GCM10009797_24270 [Nocardioides hwasunensis]